MVSEKCPLFLGAAIIAGWALFGAPAAAAELTFTRDIAPALWQQCGGCHRPGGSAPFSLVNYRDVVPRAKAIVVAVTSRRMPPWLPAQGHGDFVGERRLAQEEIDRIVQWVREGTPEGRRADLPATPTWRDGWQLGTPDLVVTLPEPYQLSRGGAEQFRTFVMPIPLERARYVRGVEIRPGNLQAVHHASLSIDRTSASRRLDEADPEPGFSGGMIAATARSPGNRAIGWTPGLVPALEPDGMGWRLERNTDLVLNLHLLPSPAGSQGVRPSVGFYFTDAAPTRASMDFKLGSKSIEIPAGDAAYAVEDRVMLPVDADLLGVYPHAHYLASDLRASATLPDGSTQSLLWIPRWDFHWQQEYRYRTPIALPAGTVLTMRYTYDNSATNRRAPAPPRTVGFGPLSTDEMGDLWLRLALRTPADAATLGRAYRDHELRKDIEAAQRMVAREPREVRWRNALGAAYLEAGRALEAVKHLEEAIRLAPGQPEARHNLGHALHLLQRLDEAIPHLQEAARLAPQNEVVQLNLADTLQDAGRIAEAIPHYERAIAIHPAMMEAFNNLGVALGSLGRLDDAIARFRQALAIDPDYADARKNLETALSAARR